MKRRSNCAALRLALLLFGFLLAASLSGARETKQAQIDVSGLGWLGDREMKVSLGRLLGSEHGPSLDADAVEDAMFLVMSAVQEKGFRKPVIELEIIGTNNERTTLSLDAAMTVSVPRTLHTKAIHLRVIPGTQYFVGGVTIRGLSAVPMKTALSFFLGESTLFAGTSARAFTPARLSRGVESLETELHQRGYAEATVRAGEVTTNDQTGEVRFDVEVVEGVPWRVADIRVDAGPVGEVKTDQVARFIGQWWSESLQQDVATEVRKTYFRAAYPDVQVRMMAKPDPPINGQRKVVITAVVQPGEKVTVGEVRFTGAGHTREEVLRRRVMAESGAPLNLVELEQARYRISRLGVFERVDLRYEPATGPVRDAVFELQAGRRIEVNLLAGYGTYEQLRGGVELRQFNLFGRAHQTRGLLVESMKSSRGEYAYTVPELFGESIDGTARLFGLQREEVAFDRQEYGGTVALSSPQSWLEANATAGYTYQALRNKNNELETKPVDVTHVTVASLDLGLTRDRRDNPLAPRRGYRWFAQLEAASRVFGGEAEYQRSEVGGTYHTGWGNGRWLHLSLAHGVITTWGNTDQALPVNKRFYPGGDGSIRGYPTGKASPRGADGRFIGAKSYISGAVEFEQALARKWSAVLFADGVGAATELRHYPLDSTLYAVGAGLRYQTLIGPIRGEYGRNLKPRVEDPSGTWLLSIGFPF